MRPTHVNILGRSKGHFAAEVQRRLRVDRIVGRLIKRLSPGSTIIELSEAVKDSADIDPLLAFLVSHGIPLADVRVRYPSASGEALLVNSLAGGLEASPLTFGPDVAERDDGLARYFIKTSAFTAVQQHKRHLVVGPKGSGSAMLRELNALNGNSLVITPEHYATEVLQALQKTPVGAETSAFVTTWKYTLLVEIFRRLVQKQVGDPAALQELRRYLVAHGHLDNNLTLFERFVGYLRRIGQVKGKIGPVSAELSSESIDQLNKLFKMDELLSLVPSLQKALRRSAFTVFIDELDQSWDNSETANQFLVSLLTAAIQLRGLADNLHVVVFLRSEIFDLLKPHLPQLDKVRSDVEVLQWSRRDLANLIASRALDSLQIASTVSAESVLKTIFPGVIGNTQLPGFDYILSRTSLRPREVIQFCNLALAKARTDGKSAIDSEAIRRAEEEFSSWKLEYIVAENMYIHPRLDDLLDQFRGRSRSQVYNALDAGLADILLESSDRHVPPAWFRADLEPADIIDLLYRLEIVGIEKLSRDGSVAARPWEGYDFVFSRPKGKPERSPSFLFHPGLWSALELA